MRTVWMTGFFLVAHFAQTFAVDWAQVVKPAVKQVPRVEVLKDGEKGICSGVVLDRARGYLLTAAHCVPGKPEDLSITVNGRHAEVARVNRILDLAVLRFSPKDEQAMPLAEDTPPIGTECAVVGFGLGIEKLAVQFGRVSQALNDETKTLWIDGVMLPGNSGGAVIDGTGKLIGMTSRVYYSGPSSVGGAIPIEQISDFVQQYLPKEPK